jgi:hypothetical protein
MVGACRMATKKNSVTFRIALVATKIFGHHRKLTCAIFKKNVTCVFFLTTKKIRSPLNMGGVWNGNWKTLIII